MYSYLPFVRLQAYKTSDEPLPRTCGSVQTLCSQVPPHAKLRDIETEATRSNIEGIVTLDLAFPSRQGLRSINFKDGRIMSEPHAADKS